MAAEVRRYLQNQTKLKSKRLLRKVRRRFTLEELFAFFALILAGLIGALSNLKDPRILCVVILYGVCVVSQFLIRIWRKRRTDEFQAMVAWGVMNQLNYHVFKGSDKVRFTIFQCDPLDSSYIIPTYRYRAGGFDAIRDAEESFARYRCGEGTTGKAWEDSGSMFPLIFYPFPKFKNHHDLASHYQTKHHVSEETAVLISEYMVGTRAILSFGLTDEENRFLGVLSIDIQSPVKSEGSDGNMILTIDNQDDTTSQKNGKLQIRGDQLILIWDAAKTMLSTFRRIKERGRL